MIRPETERALRSVESTVAAIRKAIDLGDAGSAFDFYANGLTDDVSAFGMELAADINKLALEAKRNRESGRKA